MSTDKKKIESQLLSITRNFLSELEAERALQAVTLDVSLEKELGIGSLEKVELYHRIEKAFTIQLPENAMTESDTLNDLATLLENLLTHSSKKISYHHYASELESTSIDLSSAKTLLDILFSYAEKEPKRPHLYIQDETGEETIIRYGQLFEEAQKIASGLYQRGIKPGDTIAIMLPTSAAFFYTFLGTLLAGAIPVPIYPPFRPDRIEEYAKREAAILQNAQARMLITFSRAETLSKLLLPFIPSLKEVTTVKRLMEEKNIALPDLSIEENEPALIQYTSGSTGNPKGVLLTHVNMLANIRTIGNSIPLKNTDVAVSWLPLYHDMGLMSWLASFYFGIPLTILSPITFLTRPEKWLWTIHYHRATLSGGPNFAYELCVKRINHEDIEGLDLSTWRFAFNGAEAIHPKTLKQFYEKFSRYGFKLDSFAPVYGLAESTVGLTFPKERRIPLIDRVDRSSFEKEKKAVPSTHKRDILEFVACGEPMKNHEIRFVDDNDHEVPERTIGNLQFKGPSSMQGYFNNPTATQKAFHKGWWDSGDLGYRVGNEIFITGRKKDLIIKAGRNLYPEEIENLVSQLPGIRKGCVIAFGIHDSNIGTEKLVIVAETYSLDKKRKQALHAEIIEKVAIELDIPPDIIILVPPHTIPKTSSGKLQRSACKKTYLEGKLKKPSLPVKLQFIKLAFNSLIKKSLSGIMYGIKFLYTLYASIITFIIFLIAFLIILPLSQKKTAKVMRFFARLFFRCVLCPITVKNNVDFSKKSPCIYASNHASYIDSLLLLATLPEGILFVGKKELLSVPIMRTFIKKLNYITVDRVDFTKSIETKSVIEERIKLGYSVVIFPEGTFTYATGLRPFKLGAFTIAAETNAPICPVSIQGSRFILRGTNKLAQPKALTVTLGELIYPKGNTWDEIIRLHALVRSQIAKYCGEPVIDLIVAGPKKD